MQDNNNVQSPTQMHEEEGFDLKKFWAIFVINWPWVILSVIVCVGVSFAYLKFKPSVYAGRCKVFIKDDSRNRSARRLSSANGMDLSQMGIISATDGFDNELEIVSSTYIASRAVRSLKLYVSYALDYPVVKRELYKNSPVLVDIEEGRLDELDDVLKFTITKQAEKVLVECEVKGKGNDTLVYTNKKEFSALPADMSTPYGRILFTPNPGYEMGQRALIAYISPVMSVARQYARRLTCTPTSKTTTVAEVSFTDTQQERLIEYLNAIVKLYNVDANEDKNDVGRQTEAFINERLDVIRHELDSTEMNLQQFKQSNELTDIVNNASTALAGTNEFQRRQVEIQTQMSIVKSLIDYVNNPMNAHKTLPSSSLLGTTAVTPLIDNYNQTVAERTRLLKTSSESSPVIVKLTETLENTLPAIQQALHAYHNELATQKRSVDQQYARFTGKVASAPSQERTLTNILRQQEIQSSLYLTLLQKREENAIALASIAEKARLIDPPLLDKGRVSPRGSIVLALGLLFGFGFPIGLFWLLDMLHIKVEGRTDVERLTKLSILADIPLTKKLDKSQDERAIVVKENSNNMMEEAFRGLRTNMRFVMAEGENVLLVTSVIPGEGKTFVATNLAMSMALLGRKVIVVGLDIRKPRLVNLFKLESNRQGLTNYLMTDGSDLSLLEEQIFHGVINENLDVLPAGVIPPNPAELIARPQLGMAIEHLRKIYDFVIIDTPPIGLVTDTFDIAPLADASLIVCRADYSPKGNFDLINQVYEDNKMPKMNIVLNGINLKSKKYGYYYGYGKYGKYGRYGYGRYGRYGHYGLYGHYGDQSQHGGGTREVRTEK